MLSYLFIFLICGCVTWYSKERRLYQYFSVAKFISKVKDPLDLSQAQKLFIMLTTYVNLTDFVITVKVGYLYYSCTEVFWKILRATLQGHDPSVGRAIGDWTFDIHHLYYPEKGDVYLGNGGQIKLMEQPPMISTVMGNGNSRHVTCNGCDGKKLDQNDSGVSKEKFYVIVVSIGPADRSKLLSPIALTSDSSGNVYVGDHDFIRKLDSSGNVSSLFSTKNPSSKVQRSVRFKPRFSGKHHSLISCINSITWR